MKHLPLARHVHTLSPVHLAQQPELCPGEIEARWAEAAGQAALQGVETRPWRAMPHDSLSPPVLAVPEDRSCDNHRSSSLAAWYVILSTKPRVGARDSFSHPW